MSRLRRSRTSGQDQSRQGRLTIAHRFIGGEQAMEAQASPVRDERSSLATSLIGEWGGRRPGRWSSFAPGGAGQPSRWRDPPLKRWAVFGRPCGTGAVLRVKNLSAETVLKTREHRLAGAFAHSDGPGRERAGASGCTPNAAGVAGAGGRKPLETARSVWSAPGLPALLPIRTVRGARTLQMLRAPGAAQLLAQRRCLC